MNMATEQGKVLRAADWWRRLPYSRGPTERHIRLGNALVRLVTAPTLWWHSTGTPTLILGTGQHPEDLGIVLAPDNPTSVVRRHTGGTAVYAAPGVLGLDVALPAVHPLAGTDVVEAYRWLGEVWACALLALGVDVHVVSIAEAHDSIRQETDRIVRMACFGSLSPYEITAGGRKLVGFAQVRRRAGILLQSGIHIHFDAAGLAALLPAGDPASIASRLRDRAVGLDEVAGRSTNEIDIMKAFEGALRTRLGVSIRPGAWTAEELTFAASDC